MINRRSFLYTASLAPIGLALPSPETVLTIPAWLEVNISTVAIRQWAAPNAPLIAQAEHGTQLYAKDAISAAQGQIWLKVTHHEQVGWLQLSHVTIIT